ncbi:hypothetical protein [Bradyrhizobium sp. USDA 4350]
MTEFAEWYAAVGATLDDARDDAAIFVPVMWTTGGPAARFAWVDRRLRVWRSDDRNVLTCVASLKAEVRFPV